MEEMPEYQICEKCRKRGTPNMRKCWNCGAPYPGFENDDNVRIFNPCSAGEGQADAGLEPAESIKPCEIEEMDFCKKLFAYNLLLNGEMSLSFCECEKCTESLSELLAFIMECNPEDGQVQDELEKIDRSSFIFDASIFGMISE